MNSVDTDRFLVKASLGKHIDGGFVWITSPSYKGRHVVRILNQENNNTIYCEAIKIGDNFRKEYKNENTKAIDKGVKTIVISKWYRDKLDIPKNKDVSLKIDQAEWWSLYCKIRASLSHPNNAIRLATIIALISLFLGIVGFGIAVTDNIEEKIFESRNNIVEELTKTKHEIDTIQLHQSEISTDLDNNYKDMQETLKSMQYELNNISSDLKHIERGKANK